MGRHKTIADADVLRIARDVFTHHGHTATTRQVAEAVTRGAFERARQLTEEAIRLRAGAAPAAKREREPQ